MKHQNSVPLKTLMLFVSSLSEFKNMEGLLEELKQSLHFKEFTIVRNPMNALSVGNLLECMHNLLDIRKSILMRNLTNVWNVARIFDFIHS